MTTPAVVRFAPSPTGQPHLGNLRTALFDWLLARSTGGRFILRIDDTDRARYDASAEAAMIDALAWLALDADEGPVRQSERLGRYHEAADQLMAAGAAYRPGGEPQIVRLRTDTAALHQFEDVLRGSIEVPGEDVPRDPVLIKSDGYPTYHLASTVDDIDMNITHVLRGAEWIPSTPIHMQIIAALGADAPAWVHLPLVVDPNGKKFSKRDAASQVATYRAEGYLPGAMINALALLGWHPGTEQDVFSVEELVEAFSVERLNVSNAVLDPDRLRWFNRQHLARLQEADLAALLTPVIGAVYDVERPAAWWTMLAHTIRDEVTVLSDAPGAARFAFEFDLAAFDDDVIEMLHSDAARAVIEAAIDGLRDADPLTLESSNAFFKDLRTRFKKSDGWGGRAVMMPLRAALTGALHGPHLSDAAAVLGNTGCIERLEAVQRAGLLDH